jgi:hypothetical protein
MEHDEKPLPIDIRLLGALAEKVYYFMPFDMKLSVSISCVVCFIFSSAMHMQKLCITRKWNSREHNPKRWTQILSL